MLSMVMAAQTVLTGSANPAGAAYPITGAPEAAFESLTMGISDAVENNMLKFRVDGFLDDDYLHSEYERLANSGQIMTEDVWDKDKGEYVTYDAYLSAQTAFKDITFSTRFLFNDGGVDVTPVSGDIYTTISQNGIGINKKIGTYSVSMGTADSKQTAKLTCTLNNMIYNYGEVFFGQDIVLALDGLYDDGTDIGHGSEGGDNNFTIDIDSSYNNAGQDSNYTIKKDVVPRQAGDPNIKYKITAAIASASEASLSEASGAEASGAETRTRSRKSKRAAKAASAAIADHDDDWDPEDDADWEDDGDGIFRGPGLSGLIDALTPKSSGGTSSEISDEKTLHGKSIVDAIPEGLSVRTITKQVNGEAGVIIYEGGESKDENLHLSDGLMQYDIQGEPDKPVTSLVLTIDTHLSDALYNEYMASGEEKEWTFSNRAVLRDEDNKALAIGKADDQVIKLGLPFDKNGEALSNFSNKRFKWTLEANSWFSNDGVQLYVVDHIKDIENTHNYVMDEGTGVRIGGGTYKIEMLSDTPLTEEAAEKYKYENMKSIEMIEALFKMYDFTPESSDNPVVYQYERSNGTTDAVMLIPLSAHKNQKVEITYWTDVAVDLGDLAAGNQSGEIARKLFNAANIFWRWPKGEGPGAGGTEEFGGAEIQRTHDVKYSIVKKTSGGYNEQKNIMTWNFEVNQFGADLEDLIITDQLNKSEQSFAAMKKTGEASYEDIIMKPYTGSGSRRTTPGGGAERTVRYVAPDAYENASGDRYTIETNAEGELLKMSLKPITKDLHYIFSIRTSLTKLNSDTSGNGDTWTVTNQAGFTGTANGTPITTVSKASCPVANTVIRKQAIPFKEGTPEAYKYNFTDNTVKWRVKVNPYSWEITKPEIVDQLPKGTRFHKITKVSYDGSEISPVENPNGGNGALYEAGNFTVEFSEREQNSALGDGQYQLLAEFKTNDNSEVQLYKPFEFEFTTYVEEAHRIESFKSDPTGKTASLINPVQLTGTYGGEEFTAKDKATNKFEPMPLLKKGQYFGPEVVDAGMGGQNPQAWGAKWTLYVNRTKSPMGGAIVTDTINDCMELVPETLKVYTVDLDETGKQESNEQLIYPSNAPDQTLFTKISADQFVFVIPDSLAEKTLKFTYTTIMVDNAKADEITNRVNLSYKGNEDTTGDVKADGSLSFDMDSYAHASGMYFTKLNKISANTATGQQFPLQGAAFTIQEMQLTAGGDPGLKDSWEEKTDGLTRTRVSGNDGKVSLMFLKPDTLYRITEDTPPAGYEKADFEWYVVPKLLNDNNTYPQKPDNPKEAKYTVEINRGTANYLLLDIINKPNSAEGSGFLSFKKTGHQGQVLKDVTFTLKDDEGKLKDRTFKSDENGIVLLDGLDVQAGKVRRYTLVETVPAGYTGSASLKLKVSYDSVQQKVVAEFVEPMDKLTQENGTYVLKNDAITKTGSFRKTDQNGDALLEAGITFSVERRGDGGQILGQADGNENSPVILDVDRDAGVTDKSSYQPYLPLQTVQTDAFGGVALSNLLYGDYRLIETAGPADAQSGNELATIYLTVNSRGIFASLTSLEDARSERNKLTARPDDFLVSNDIKQGAIRISKRLGEFTENGTIKDMDKAISGIRFNLYREKDGGQETNPYITLTTNSLGGFDHEGDRYGDGADKKELLAGTYYLEEVYEADSPYRPLTQNPVKFVIQDGRITELVHDGNGAPGYRIVDAQTPVQSFYNILKCASVEGVKYTSDKGEKRIPLAGAKFELTPIGETPGPSRTAVSGPDGHFIFKEVPLGTYEMREIETPDGYRGSDKVVRVQVTEDKVHVTKDVDGSLIEFWNEAFGSLTLIKRAEVIENGSIGGVLRPGQGFAFYITGESKDGAALETLVRESDIVGAETVSIISEGETAGIYVITDAAGKITISNLPVGEYSIQEQINGKNNEAGIYRPDTQIKAANITITHATGKIISPIIGIDNYLKRGAIQGLKTVSDKTTPLKGAVIGLFPAGTTEFTKENLWCGQKLTTGENGIFLFKNIPYGTYVVAELEAPNGYYLNADTRYEVTVKTEETTAAGRLIEGTVPGAEADTAILIANRKKPSGGGGGGGITPTQPSETQAPTAPSESSPLNPGETRPSLPQETAPGVETVIPVPPQVPPGSNVEVSKPDGETVYRGTTDGSGSIRVTLPPGEYNVVMIDDNSVPLGTFPFIIEDLPVPLGAPAAGDQSLPITVLAVMMMVSLAGMVLLIRRKKELKENEKAK